MSNGSEVARRGETEILSADGEVLDLTARPSALEAVTRAEIDVQVATAKRFPRSVARSLNDAKSMVAIDPDLAAQCTFALPPRAGSKEWITGPSVRLAEIMAVCWGNLRVVGRVTDDDGKFVTCQGVAVDLERNVGYSVEVTRGVTTRGGQRFGDEMLKMTRNAGIAIATRNATFKVIPRAFVSLVEDEARRVAKGDVKTLPDRVGAALDWFSAKGVADERVFAVLGVGGPADFTLDLLGKLNGMRTAIKDGHSSVDEVFPRPEPVAPAPARGHAESKAEALTRKLTGGAAQPKADDKAPADLGWVHGGGAPAPAREPGMEG